LPLGAWEDFLFNGLYHFPKIVGAIRESPLQQIDLGAENTIAAQRDREKIAVEIKRV